MPEEPEVRRFADMLNAALSGKSIGAITARIRGAKAWLSSHPEVLADRIIEKVRSHGKHLIG